MGSRWDNTGRCGTVYPGSHRFIMLLWTGLDVHTALYPDNPEGGLVEDG